jgi:hypothetical protein
MEITYRVTFWEVIEIMFYQLTRNFGFMVSVGSLFGVMLNNVIRLNNASFSLQDKIIRMAILTIPVSLIPILFGVIYLGLLKKAGWHNFLQIKHDGKLLVSKSGLVHTIADIVIETKWAEITQVNQNRKYIFMCFPKKPDFIIPKRTFQNSDSAMDFYNYAYQLWKDRETS